MHLNECALGGFFRHHPPLEHNHVQIYGRHASSQNPWCWVLVIISLFFLLSWKLIHISSNNLEDTSSDSSLFQFLIIYIDKWLITKWTNCFWIKGVVALRNKSEGWVKIQGWILFLKFQRVLIMWSLLTMKWHMVRLNSVCWHVLISCLVGFWFNEHTWSFFSIKQIYPHVQMCYFGKTLDTLGQVWVITHYCLGPIWYVWPIKGP